MATADEITHFAALVAGAERIACLSGAGMSTESGIPDYRSKAGLYQNLTSEKVFSIELFVRAPERFYAVIGPLYQSIITATPNAGHRALAELARLYGKQVVIATQNIDGLHQKAGSALVHEVHGTMDTLSCQACGGRARAADFLPALMRGEVLHHCCGGVLKPDITFYGEMLPMNALRQAQLGMMGADLVMVLGTSLQVYPAADLPSVRPAKCPLVIINRSPTVMDDSADLVFHESIGELLPLVMAQVAVELGDGRR